MAINQSPRAVNLVPLVLWASLAAVPGWPAELLNGEFGDIDLGRPLVERDRFPTIKELRLSVGKPEISTVLMFKLFHGNGEHHLPVFSGDGLRVAFQRSDTQAGSSAGSSGKGSSKLLLFLSLDQAEPILLSKEPDVYDYMFRWAINGPGSYAFVRLVAGKADTDVYFGQGNPAATLRRKTPGNGRYLFPAVYGRTDGIWRMVYEEEGRLMHQAWNDEGPVDRPTELTRGSSPRWSRDGYRLLIARQRPGRTGVPTYDMVVRNLRTETEVLLPSGLSDKKGLVRSPAWSPDETAAAFFIREGSEGSPWRIRVCTVPASSKDHGDSQGRTVGNDVVVNQSFQSEGPAWEPSSGRVWFFSHKHQRQAYYPLVAADVRSGATAVVDYPSRCTTPNDLAINPAGLVPEIALVAHDALSSSRDLFVVFLNHY